MNEEGTVESIASDGNLDDMVHETEPKQETDRIRDGLAGIEFSETGKAKCRGNISNESGNKTEVAFDYYHAEQNALDFELTEENKEYLNKDLALKDIRFHVYSREIGENGSIEDRPDRKVYLLMHGWTATHAIYTEVIRQNDLTMVEEILARDPSAIIVVPDGNGFGETRFKTEFEKSEIDKYKKQVKKENMDDLEVKKNIISEKSTPEYYAMQMEFLLGIVLDLEGEYNDKKEKVKGSPRVAVLGHSMGGAAAMILTTRWGYESLASAPALFPSKDNEKYMKDHQDILRKNKAAERLYRFLGNSTYLADVVGRLREFMSSISEIAVQQVFVAIANELMGRKISGDPKKDKSMLQHLGAIHIRELTKDKFHTISTTILNLINGIDFSEWSMKEIANLKNVEIICGKFDTLVPWEELMYSLTTIAAYALDAQRDNVPGSDEASDAATKLIQRVIQPDIEENAEAEMATWLVIRAFHPEDTDLILFETVDKEQYYRKLFGEDYKLAKNLDESGHYRALLGDEKVVRKLVAMAHENKGEEK